MLDAFNLIELGFEQVISQLSSITILNVSLINIILAIVTATMLVTFIAKLKK